jgi:hypothetical protein
MLTLGLGAIDLIAALIAALPDAVIRIIPDVTRHFHELEFNARVLGTGIQADPRADIWTSLRESIGESGKTILPAGPLGDREASGLGKVVRLADVPTVLFVVEPLPGVGCGW